MEGNSKALHQLWCLQQEVRSGQQSKNLVARHDALRDARGSDVSVQPPPPSPSLP